LKIYEDFNLFVFGSKLFHTRLALMVEVPGQVNLEAHTEQSLRLTDLNYGSTFIYCSVVSDNIFY